MGIVIHEAIVVTGFVRAHVDEARQKALDLKLPVSEVVDSPVNGFASFLIASDGSKEGWADSDAGDEARAQWIAWAREQWRIAATPPFKGGSFLHFVHVRYGDVGDEEDDDESELAEWQPDAESPR